MLRDYGWSLTILVVLLGIYTAMVLSNSKASEPLLRTTASLPNSGVLNGSLPTEAPMADSHTSEAVTTAPPKN